MLNWMVLRHGAYWVEVFHYHELHWIFRFRPDHFEQDYSEWETLKARCERQAGAPLPDNILVATLLNKTTGALQQHLRLNVRTMDAYETLREVITAYYQSRHAENYRSMDTGGAAPMDVVARCGEKAEEARWAPLWNTARPGKNKKHLSKLGIIVAAFQYLLRKIFTDESTNRTNHQPASVNVKNCPLLMVNPHFCWYNAQVCRSPLRFLRGLHPVMMPPASWLPTMQM